MPQETSTGGELKYRVNGDVTEPQKSVDGRGKGNYRWSSEVAMADCGERETEETTQAAGGAIGRDAVSASIRGLAPAGWDDGGRELTAIQVRLGDVLASTQSPGSEGVFLAAIVLRAWGYRVDKDAGAPGSDERLEAVAEDLDRWANEHEADAKVACGDAAERLWLRAEAFEEISAEIRRRVEARRAS